MSCSNISNVIIICILEREVNISMW
jgi:hypothetical protein